MPHRNLYKSHIGKKRKKEKKERKKPIQICVLPCSFVSKDASAVEDALSSEKRKKCKWKDKNRKFYLLHDHNQEHSNYVVEMD